MLISHHVTAGSLVSVTTTLFRSSMAPSMVMLQSAGSLPRRSRSHRQIRTLRIGLWSSYLDPSFQKEIQRHHRTMKHKYVEALNTKLSWVRQDHNSSRNVNLKGFMCSAWRGQDLRPRGRWGDLDGLDLSREDPQPPSSGTGDLEQARNLEQANSDLSFQKNERFYDRMRTKSRIWFMSADGGIVSSSSRRKSMPGFKALSQEDLKGKVQRHTQHSLEPDKGYEIDPITNRKVFKSQTFEDARKSVDTSTNSSKGDRSDLQDFLYPASKRTESPTRKDIPPRNLKNVGDSATKSFIRDTSSGGLPEDRSVRPENFTPQFEVQGKSEYFLKGSPAQGSAKSLSQERETPERTLAVQEEELESSDSRADYGSVMYKQSDGILLDTACSVQEGLKEYDNRVCYEPIQSSGLDGSGLQSAQIRPQDPRAVEEGLRGYDSKISYGTSARCGLSGHSVQREKTLVEASQRPGHISKNRRKIDAENTSSRAGSGNRENLLPYLSNATVEDLDLLRPSDVRAGSGIVRKLRRETETEKLAIRKRLEEDFQKEQFLQASLAEDLSHVTNSRHGSGEQNKLSLEQLLIEKSELQNIHGHLRGKVVAKIEDISEAAPPNGDSEITGHCIRDFPLDLEPRHTSPEDLESLKPETETTTPNLESTSTHSFMRDSNTPRLQTSLDRTSNKDFGERNADAKIRLQNEIDPYSRQPMGLETSYSEEVTLQNDKDPYSKKPFGLETSYADELVEKRTLENEKDPYSKEPQGLETNFIEEVRLQNEKDPYSKNPIGLETSYNDELSEEHSLANERDPYSKKPQGLETSFIEEVRLREEQDPYSKKPMGLETSFTDELLEKRSLEIEKDPYSKEPKGLETSYIEEVKIQNERDPYSKQPMGLETNFAEEVDSQLGEGDVSAGVSDFRSFKKAEDVQRTKDLAKEAKSQAKKTHQKLVQELRDIYEDQYGVIDSKHRQTPKQVGGAASSKLSDSDEGTTGKAPFRESYIPTIYKILAYNPTMQEIDVAETSSIVPDSASPLTPAEVLLRLSNPAKFFPHFATLQEEGYEIVSGSGDVLIFRKVREPGHKTKQQEKRISTNPIDGMQSQHAPATGNFASPTGFVNHDIPSQEPAFKSNIDVRRQEPVFSGTPNWQDQKQSGSQSKGRGKRLLIGAAWVAGCSYAIGIVTEFFKTGGKDGRGPQGF